MKPRVIVVAGGLATRMKTISEKVPKCLLRLDKKPLIQHQIEFFKRKGYTNFIFCIAYLGDKIKKYFKDGNSFGVNIHYSEEPEDLLGTAGTVKLIQSMLDNTFIVYYGDILTNEDFDKVLQFHKQKNSDFTIVVRLLRRGYISSSLIIMDENYRTKVFIEKPSKEDFEKYKDEKRYINNGIYIIEPKILPEIPQGIKYDFAKQLIPKLLKMNMNVYCYVSSSLFEEIGTMEKYGKFKEKLKENKIENEWKQSSFFR